MAATEKRELSVSVIIPNYNYGRFVGEAVESVLAQTYPCREITVVDDGSTDESLEVLARYEKAHPGRVRVVRQQNRGVGLARNAGVEHSTGDLVGFLDADDYWTADKIEKQVARFLADEEVGMVSCGMEEFDAAGRVLHHYLSQEKGWMADKILAFNSRIVVGGSAVLVRRAIFEAVGGYDHRKELHPSEDWELGYRIARVCKIDYVPELLVRYRNHGGNGHLQSPRMERAMLLAYEKIYADALPDVRKLKNESYGNLYSVLAGSYFHAGAYADFLRTTALSLRHKPAKITRLLGFPVRFLQRRLNSAA